jgi:RNA polymerase subunit RPABC4/transcription elongation factor Spt4
MSKDKAINPKDAIGRSKPSLCSIPSTALAEQALAHMEGHGKYGYYNWRTVPKVSCMTYLDGAERHIRRFQEGNERCPICGCHELAHAIASLNIVIDAQYANNLHDDRPPKTVNFDKLLEDLSGKIEAHYELEPKPKR